MNEGITPEEEEEFLDWAYGKGYVYKNMPHRWILNSEKSITPIELYQIFKKESNLKKEE